MPDRSQVALYQQVHICFSAAVFQVRPAYYVDGGGEIDLVTMLCFFRCGNGNVLRDHLAEVVQDQPCIDLLED